MTHVDSRRTVDAPQPRDLTRVAFGPSLVALIVIAAITLVQLVVANSDLTGTLGAVASMWLAVHGVPVSIAGQELGVLPLAPVAAMVWATARSTAQVTSPKGSWFVLRWIVASAVGGPLLVAAIALAVVHDAASVITDLQTPNALGAFAAVAGVHGLGALIGVGSKAGRRLAVRLGLPAWLADSVRPAAIGVLALLALSCAVVAASLVLHWGTMHELFGITDTFVGQLSLTALSLLYLPNVVIGTAAMAVGSSAHIGFATFSAFTVFGGDIPALPILAAVPTPPLGPGWVALLIVGAVAGVALGQQCARRPLPLAPAFAKLAASALLAAGMMVVLGWVAGGALGNFGQVGVDQAMLGPGALFWFLVIGGMTMVISGGVTAGRARVRTGPTGVPPVAVADEPRPASPTEAAEGRPEPETEPETAPEAGTEPEPEPETEPEAEPEAAGEPDLHPESEPDPVRPPPVKPAPDLEDVEDLMFVDDDIDPGSEQGVNPGIDVDPR